MPDQVPRGDGLMAGDLLTDPGVRRDQRAANVPVFQQNELTQREKYALVDLAKAFHKEISPAAPFGWAAYKKFLKKVFKNWNSFNTHNPTNTIKKRDFQHTNVPAGTLLEDCPGKDGSCPPHRKHGVVVYLSLTLNLEREALNFLWKDAQGNFVNPKFIKYTNDDKAFVFDMAIQNYDTCERQRTQKHNNGNIITVARRRIVKWVAIGSRTDPIIDPADGVPPMEPLVLTYDHVMEMHDLFSKLRAKHRARAGEFSSESAD